MSDNTKITREDLESKFGQVKAELDDRKSIMMDKAVPVAIVGGIAVLALVYFIGKRVGTKKSAIVEIRRI